MDTYVEPLGHWHQHRYCKINNKRQSKEICPHLISKIFMKEVMYIEKNISNDNMRFTLYNIKYY